MYSGYLYFRETEVANNQRVMAYLEGDPDAGIAGLRHPNSSLSADCGCDALCLYCDLGDGVDGHYTTPRRDKAPWFDPAVPDSEDFAGLFITDVSGFDSTIQREFIEGAISGGSLGPMRLTGRCVTFTGWLRAKTCCGAEYGLRWLQEALMGGNACDDCGSGDLYMIRCCPPDSDTCHVALSAETPIDREAVNWLTVTDAGDGMWSFVLADPNQSGLVSDPSGAPNNADGAIPSCYSADGIFRVVLTDGAGATFTFVIPAELVSGFITNPSGGGAEAAFLVDTTVESDCDDVARLTLDLISDIEIYRGQYGSGATVSMRSLAPVRCFEIREGANPGDYVRLMHRTGVTSGPTVIDRQGTCCSDCGCVNIEVQFTLCSELPYLYSDIDWCIKDKTFDLDECYCIDLRRLCEQCERPDATKLASIEVARKPAPINLLHTGEWCPVGWSLEKEGCPPATLFLDINDAVPFDPNDASCSGSATDNEPCLIRLFTDRTWSPTNFTIPTRGFPPEFCKLEIFGSGTCDTTNPNNCLVRIVYNEGTGAQTWEPIGWSGAVPFPGSCDCVIIAEVCVIPAPGDCAPVATQCPINVKCDTAFRPDICTSRQGAAAFFYRANGSPPFVPPAIPTFSDVPPSHPFYLEIEWVAAQGIFAGFADGTFRPASPLSRQAAASGFYNDAGSPPFAPPPDPTFTDVPITHPFYLQIEWCAAQGIFTGFADGSFRPADCLSRQASAAAFYRAAGSPPFIPPSSPTFIDVPITHPFYLEIEWMAAEGITTGFVDGLFWEPLGWTLDPDKAFPPEGCNITIAEVNGQPPDLSPVRQTIEVPYDEFVPDCGPFPVPPPSPLLFTGEQCFCEPWTQARECCTFSNLAEWNEATTVVELWTGSSDLRNFRIEAYQNPFGDQVPCPCDPQDPFWECRTPCSSILIPQLPARSKLLIDSRLRVAQLELSSGRVVNALRYIFAADGKPFEWFDIAQCATFCVMITADCSSTAADASVSVGAVGRYVSSGG